MVFSLTGSTNHSPLFFRLRCMLLSLCMVPRRVPVCIHAFPLRTWDLWGLSLSYLSLYLLCLVLWLKEGKRFPSQIFCRVGWSIQGRGSFCQSLELLALMTSQCFGNILSTDMELELLVSDPVMASLGDYSEVGGFSWSLQYSPHQDPDLDRKKFKVYFQRSSVYSCKLRDLLWEEGYHIKAWWRGFPISIAVSRKNVTFLWKTTFLIFFSFLL